MHPPLPSPLSKEHDLEQHVLTRLLMVDPTASLLYSDLKFAVKAILLEMPGCIKRNKAIVFSSPNNESERHRKVIGMRLRLEIPIGK